MRWMRAVHPHWLGDSLHRHQLPLLMLPLVLMHLLLQQHRIHYPASGRGPRAAAAQHAWQLALSLSFQTQGTLWACITYRVL